MSSWEEAPFGDEKRCLAYMAEVGLDLAPARFALWQVRGDWYDARVVGWGLSYGGQVLLDMSGDRLNLKQLSRPGLDRYVEATGLKLLWVDPEPAENPL